MRRAVLSEADSGPPLRIECECPTTPWARMRGLLGREGLAEGHGMLFGKTSSVHTFFMRFPIDVVFLDRELRVLKVTPDLPAGKTTGCKGARWTLELAAGEAARLRLDTGRVLRRD